MNGWRLVYLGMFGAFIVVVVLIAVLLLRKTRGVMDKEDGYVPPEDDRG